MKSDLQINTVMISLMRVLRPRVIVSPAPVKEAGLVGMNLSKLVEMSLFFGIIFGYNVVALHMVLWLIYDDPLGASIV